MHFAFIIAFVLAAIACLMWLLEKAWPFALLAGAVAVWLAIGAFQLT